MSRVDKLVAIYFVVMSFYLYNDGSYRFLLAFMLIVNVGYALQIHLMQKLIDMLKEQNSVYDKNLNELMAQIRKLLGCLK